MHIRAHNMSCLCTHHAHTYAKVTFDKQVLKRSVALAGDVFDPSGTLTGGSRPKTSSILAQLQDVCEAESKLQEHGTAIRQTQGELDAIQPEATKYVEALN